MYHLNKVKSRLIQINIVITTASEITQTISHLIVSYLLQIPLQTIANRICEGKFALLSKTNTFTLLLSSYPNVDICSQVNSLLNTPLVLSLHTRLSRFVYQFVTVYMHWSPISPANGMKCVQTVIAQYALESRNAILHSNHCCCWLALEISNASRVVCDGFLVWVKDFQETLSYFISWSTFKSSVAAEPLTETVRFSLEAKKYLFATRCFFMI